MEEQDVNEAAEAVSEIEKETTSSGFGGVVLYATLIVLLVGGAIFWLRFDIEKAVARNAQENHALVTKLEERLAVLEGKATELSERPAIDKESLTQLRTDIDAVSTKLSEAEKQLTLLSERTSAIESAPEMLAIPAPATAAPAPAQPEPAAAPTPPKASSVFQNLKIAILSGSPYQPELDIWYKEHPKTEVYPALKQHAAEGIPTEAELRQQLKASLTQLSSAGADSFPEKSIAGRLNQHFSNFISIRKKGSTPAEVEALKLKLDTLPLQQLVEEVGKLPQHENPTLTQWLSEVKDRADVTSDLTHLEAGL